MTNPSPTGIPRGQNLLQLVPHRLLRRGRYARRRRAGLRVPKLVHKPLADPPNEPVRVESPFPWLNTPWLSYRKPRGSSASSNVHPVGVRFPSVDAGSPSSQIVGRSLRAGLSYLIPSYGPSGLPSQSRARLAVPRRHAGRQCGRQRSEWLPFSQRSRGSFRLQGSLANCGEHGRPYAALFNWRRFLVARSPAKLAECPKTFDVHHLEQAVWQPEMHRLRESLREPRPVFANNPPQFLRFSNAKNTTQLGEVSLPRCPKKEVGHASMLRIEQATRVPPQAAIYNRSEKHEEFALHQGPESYVLSRCLPVDQL